MESLLEAYYSDPHSRKAQKKPAKPRGGESSREKPVRWDSRGTPRRKTKETLGGGGAQSRPVAAAGPGRPRHSDREPDSGASAEARRQRHSHRAVRGHVPRPARASTACCTSYRRRRVAVSCRSSRGSRFLAKMDIAEKRIPQDGAIAPANGEKRIDFRVSTVPTVCGEKMVMRILDKGAIPRPADRAGLRRTASQGLDRIDPDAARPDAGDRSDRQRQKHHALRLPEPIERAGRSTSARWKTRSSTNSRA